MLETSNDETGFSGGGIGGLSLAVVLKRYRGSKNFQVDLYESGPKFTEIGAGITVWTRTRSIFDTLGMDQALESKAVAPAFTCRKSDTQTPINWLAMHTC